MGLGGWGRIGGRINLLESCEGGVACYCKCNGFRPFVSNLVAVETKTCGERVRRRLNNILIHLHNYTGVGLYFIVVGGEVAWGVGVE